MPAVSIKAKLTVIVEIAGYIKRVEDVVSLCKPTWSVGLIEPYSTGIFICDVGRIYSAGMLGVNKTYVDRSKPSPHPTVLQNQGPFVVVFYAAEKS